MINTIENSPFTSGFKVHQERKLNLANKHFVNAGSIQNAFIRNIDAMQERNRATQKSYPCIEFTPEGYISRIKSDFANVLGFKNREFEGKHFSELINGGTPESPIIKKVWRSVLVGENVELEFNIKTKNQTELKLKSFFQEVKNRAGIVYKVYLKINQFNGSIGL